MKTLHIYISFLSLISFFPTLLRGQSLPSNQNWIKSTEYLTENEEKGDKKVEILYFDGLGREKQAIYYKASPLGKDVITHFEYDEFGRQTKEYLAVPTSQSSGHIIANPKSIYDDYYNENYNTSIYFSEKELEISILGRPLRQAAPGEDWKLDNGKEIKFDYGFNSKNEVKIYKSSTNTSNYHVTLIQNIGNYLEKELFKTITTDENGNRTIEYKNKKGQIILIRKYVEVESSTRIPYPNPNQVVMVDTHYVYDEFGNLTFVIPPLAAEKNTLSSAQISELCYQYKYDNRNRLIERKLPGKGWEFMVYDKQDRLVATQDSEMAQSTFVFPSGMTGKAWAFTKYDALGRIVYTGLYKSNETRASLQTIVDGYVQNNEVRSLTPFTQNGVTIYYSKSAFPANHSASNVDLLLVNYYDTDYSNLLPTGVTAPSSIEGDSLRTGLHSNKNSSLKGLPIASFMRIIPGNNLWEKNFTFYDQKSRPVANYKYNHLGGYTKNASKLDFRGKPIYTITYHKQNTTTIEETIVRNNFTYDEQERIKRHTHQLNNGITERISANSYNEIGQLINKLVGNRNSLPALQSVDFSYNIRGWLTDINDISNTMQLKGLPGQPLDDIFAFHIDYNELSNNGANSGLTGLYNGNISQTLWKTASDNTLRGYVYDYDKLNRLKEAVYHRPNAANPFRSNYDEKISYDINGNIMELKRYSGYDSPAGAHLTDDLEYTYATDSNKLTKVKDHSNSTIGFSDGTNTNNDYTYDLNANMISDKNKGITSIKYNHLNLPTEIQWSATKKINYLYNAAGQKVEKKVINASEIVTTQYLDGFQYVQDTLRFFPHAEGYVKNTIINGQNTFDYVYNYTDHLGNIRLSYAKDPASGELKILEENHYYPFGLKHQKYTQGPKKIDLDDNPFGKAIVDDVDDLLNPNSVLPLSVNYDYKYNGKEWQDELGLNMYDMDMRMYDPAIARWVVMDPVIHHSFSPYNAFDNNPVFFADPSGADSEGGTATATTGVTLAFGVSLDSVIEGGAALSFSGNITFNPGDTRRGGNNAANSGNNAAKNNSNHDLVWDGEVGGPDDIILPEVVINNKAQLDAALAQRLNEAMEIWSNWNNPTIPNWVGHINNGFGGLGEGLSYNGRNGNRLYVGTARPGKPVNLGVTKFYGNGKTYISPSYMGKAGKVIGKGSGFGTVVLGTISIYDGVQQDGGTFGQNASVATGGVVGGGFGAWGGAKAGAIIGGSIGSVIPVLGTGVGAIFGGVIGGIAGGYIGTELGEGVVNSMY